MGTATRSRWWFWLHGAYYVFWGVIGLGFAALLYAGRRARRPRWVRFGLAYGAVLVTSLVILVASSDGDGTKHRTATNAAGVVIDIVWIISAIHVCATCPSWLRSRAPSGVEVPALRPSWRATVATGLIGLGIVASIGLIAGYLVQQTWTRSTAMIHERSCHKASDGEGGNFTACVLDVTFTDRHGEVRSAHLTGVEATRIHDDSVVVWLDPKSPATAINPENRIPLWVFVLFAYVVWMIAGGGAALVLRQRAVPEPQVVSANR